MKYKAILVTAMAMAASAFLVGCGGGGDSTPTTANTGEGFWNGSSSTGVNVSLAILETGETWGIYTSNDAIVGALKGATTFNGNQLTGAGTDFNIPSRSVNQGSYSGTFSSKNSISVKTSNGSTFSGTYVSAYDQPASLSTVAGSFSGSGVTGNTTAQASIVGITSAGVVTSSGNGCTASGQTKPRASGKNIFDLTITFTGTNCALGNGAVTTGIAYYDAANRQLLAMALNSAKTDGFIFIGNKPSEGTPVATSTISYPLLSGYKAMVANGLSKSFAVTGTCTGSGTKSASPATTAATFEGVAGLSATSTLTMSLTGTGCTPSIAQSSTSYFDNTYLPRGMNSVGVNYGIFLTAPILPATAIVGSTGLIGTLTLYTSNTKLTGNGRIDSSYVIEADTASTGIFNLISKSYNASGTLTATEQDRYRITSTGALTPISIDIQYANTSTAHLLLTF
jgi:hypothetical protein